MDMISRDTLSPLDAILLKGTSQSSREEGRVLLEKLCAFRRNSNGDNSNKIRVFCFVFFATSVLKDCSLFSFNRATLTNGRRHAMIINQRATVGVDPTLISLIGIVYARIRARCVEFKREQFYVSVLDSDAKGVDRGSDLRSSVEPLHFGYK